MCRCIVGEVWPNGAIPGQLAQDLPTWTHFEQASELVSARSTSGVTLGSDVGAVVDIAKEFVEAGFDHVYFHQIGPDQDAWFDMWNGELADELRAL